jgi:hypothetical protein
MILGDCKLFLSTMAEDLDIWLPMPRNVLMVVQVFSSRIDPMYQTYVVGWKGPSPHVIATNAIIVAQGCQRFSVNRQEDEVHERTANTGRSMNFVFLTWTTGYPLPQAISSASDQNHDRIPR